MNMVKNVNVAILGHIDSGKTALARALTEIASTAGLDKSPQSQERGITIDLGLSCFTVSDKQVTLVDCPGHAGLIRAVLGAAQIVDCALLVVDVTKGMQTQTAECVVVAEVSIPKLIVVLNKIDLVEQEVVETMAQKLKRVFTTTKYGKDVPILEVSALKNQGIDQLKHAIIKEVGDPVRPAADDNDNSLLFLYDHCFAVKGQGTVLTGTVVAGSMKVGDVVHIVPHAGGTRKIKSMQSFKQVVNEVHAGDRVGICVTNIDPKEIERGVVTKLPVPSIQNAIISCQTIKYFKGEIKSKMKFHFTLGHSTVLGSVIFLKKSNSGSLSSRRKEFDVAEAGDLGFFVTDAAAMTKQAVNDARQKKFEEFSEGFTEKALLQLEKPVQWPLGKIFLASKLDLDIHSPGCRLAFHGTVDKLVDGNFRLARFKQKMGVIEKSEGMRYIVKDLIKKDSDVNKIIGQSVVHEATGAIGRIEGAFGKAGKLRVSFEIEGLQGAVILKYTKFLRLDFYLTLG